MITPVILCGGTGTRLWPLSRKSYPKQFATFLGSQSLFQASVERLSGTGYASPLVVTNSDFRFIVTEQLKELGIDPRVVMIEHEGRNTAGAVLAAALYLQKQDSQALMLVAPSDHFVSDAEAFRSAILVGETAARQGKLVTFGIKPTNPETGYGYLELDECADDLQTGVIGLKQFVEKPSFELAEEMLASQRFLWNTGLFLFSVREIIDAFKKHASDFIEPVNSAVKNGVTDLDFFRLDQTSWSKVKDISIDYAVMEQASNLSVVPYSGGWSDLGGWDAIWRQLEPDALGVVTVGTSTALECANTLLWSEEKNLEVVGIGLQNTIVAATSDGVLVASMSHAQDVKQAVAALKAKKAPQAETFPKDHRPWGWFDSLVAGDRFQVKRIVVHPGEALSLQSHHHRAEHWIVVEGTARVTIEETVTLVSENQSIYVPLGAKHRLENPGKVSMILIEVQTGRYLGEDDIIRYEDVYDRT